MEDNKIRNYSKLSEEERDYSRQRKLRAAMRKKKKRRRRRRILIALILVIAAGIAVWKTPLKDEIRNRLPMSVLHRITGTEETETAGETAADNSGAETFVAQESSEAVPEETAAETETAPLETIPESEALWRAERLAAMYDYDAAMECLQSADSGNALYADYISRYQQAKDSCVAVDVEQVPHVFFHSLINDDRGFRADVCGTFQAKDNACWMCTADEMRAILRQMYDAGYVMVSIHDLVTETKTEDGEIRFEPNRELMLPEGKKAFVMSEDDLSYYHMYGNQGIASRLVLDDNGKVKCEYINASGETLIGDYDVVPVLDTFVEEHPDFSYHGAKAMIALTGYNGVFGYRTDTVYHTRDENRLDRDQKEFLDAHPDFSYDQDVAEATRIAEALKADGYEFASHTWGHRHADQASVESLKKDNERWVESVQPIVGPVDTIIFAHGSDIGEGGDYSSSNEKYVYYKNAGYNYYCQVDGSRATTLVINPTNVRMGRINLDGYYLWKVMDGNERACRVFDYLGIHDVKEFFDYSRITPVEVMG